MNRKNFLYPTMALGIIFLFLSPLSPMIASAGENQFRQIQPELPTPTDCRTAAGAPGPGYWQQRADYELDIILDEDQKKIRGQGIITYHNHSPQSFRYVWLQLDQNIFQKDGLVDRSRSSGLGGQPYFYQLYRVQGDFDGGFKIDFVRDARDRDLPCRVVGTMMRVDLAEELVPGGRCILKTGWWYSINDIDKIGGRGGYRYFEKDRNAVFTIAQFFPRMAVYSDVDGWQHKQYFGSGEFALPFGDYTVRITVPSDHVVGATGVLQNPREVLTAEQIRRLEQAEKTTDQPVLIVTEEEAVEKEKSRAGELSTWVFKAEKVRDFAFASSRKFIWDAMAVPFPGHTTLAMSLYDKTGNPLWGRYSTQAVAHAMRVYSRYLFDYPYPRAVSVLAWEGGGMEYPMMAFNGGVCEEDRTYSRRTKYGHIGVVIHEFGHSYFPMIVNSDERQWAWMDEGLNTFMTYLAMMEWERDYQSGSGPAHTIVDYLRGDRGEATPIMTAPDIDPNVGANAYDKTAAGLNILRETVMGRDLFDFALKEYARRWRFKHPTPADFFRTMEDASGIDLDWFWRGWFYGTDPVDLALEKVRWVRLFTGDPAEEKKIRRQEEKRRHDEYISNRRNREDIPFTAVEKAEILKDFYNTHDPLQVTAAEQKKYREYLDSLSDEEKEMLTAKTHYYELSLSNRGGMVMPVILKIEYLDGSAEILRLPAEIWRRNNRKVTRVIASPKQVLHFTLDPFRETADIDTADHGWTVRGEPEYVPVQKYRRSEVKNRMQEFLKEK